MQLPQLLTDLPHTRRSEQKGARRITLHDVIPDRNHKKLRFELLDDRAGFRQRLEVLAIIRTGAQRKISVISHTFASAFFICVAGKIGIGLKRVSVDGKKVDIFSFIKNILCAIAVMVINIQNGHPSNF